MNKQVLINMLFKALIICSLILVLSACVPVTKNEISVPSNDIAELIDSDVLFIEVKEPKFYGANSNYIIRGSTEGSREAIDEAYEGIHTPQDMLGAILLTPLILPSAAIIGSAFAHSEEEYLTAEKIYNRVHDEYIPELKTLDKTFADELKIAKPDNWQCMIVKSEEDINSCEKIKSVKNILLFPRFSLDTNESGEKKFNPTIIFRGNIKLIIQNASDNVEQDKPFIAIWSYWEALGSYFGLVEDDGVLLQQKLNDINDKFIKAIVQEIYVPTESKRITSLEQLHGEYTIIIESSQITRIR